MVVLRSSGARRGPPFAIMDSSSEFISLQPTALGSRRTWTRSQSASAAAGPEGTERRGRSAVSSARRRGWGRGGPCRAVPCRAVPPMQSAAVSALQRALLLRPEVWGERARRALWELCLRLARSASCLSRARLVLIGFLFSLTRVAVRERF